MKSPADYAKAGTEFSHQTALFMWANMAARFGLRAASDPESYTKAGVAKSHNAQGDDTVPRLRWLFAIKNVGHGDALRGARSRAEGVKAGVPDICLPVSKYYSDFSLHCGLYIELKRPKSAGKAKGRASDIQNEWDTFLQSQGYMVQICYGWEDARDTLLNYLGVSYGAKELPKVSSFP